MSSPAGSFIWYELMTPDPDAAATFYGAVVGWTVSGAADPAAGGIDYRMLGRDDGGFAGGMLRLNDDMVAHGARPMWVPYLYAPEVDASLAAIEGEGGKVAMPATDLPVGRVAMVIDPQGVPVYLMNPRPPAGQPDATSDVFHEQALQRVGWNELASPDQAASMAFYARHFGFAFNERMPMGPMGDYCFIDHGERRVGAIMQQQDRSAPVWLLYFAVPSILAAQRAVEAGGGQILRGPHEVPGPMWVVIGRDPQGAAFGLVSANPD